MAKKSIEVGADGTQSVTTGARKFKFLRHVGGVFLRGQAVVAYTDGDNFKLVVETIGGKRVRYTAEDFNGEKCIRTIPEMMLTGEQFAAKLEQWTNGLHHQDARIVERAIDDMTPADAIEG